MKRKHYVTKQIVDLARKIGVDYTDRSILLEIECGLHSGFPTCCIAFFIKVWAPIWQAFYEAPTSRAAKHIMRMTEQYHNVDGLPIRDEGYVRCPSCQMSGKIIKVKRCKCTRNHKSWPHVPNYAYSLREQDIKLLAERKGKITYFKYNKKYEITFDN